MSKLQALLFIHELPTAGLAKHRDCKNVLVWAKGQEACWVLPRCLHAIIGPTMTLELQVLQILDVCLVTVGIPICMYRVFSTPTATFSHCGSQRNCCALKKKPVSERGASTYVCCVIGLVAPTQPALSAVMGAATVPRIRATVLHQTKVWHQSHTCLRK